MDRARGFDKDIRAKESLNLLDLGFDNDTVTFYVRGECRPVRIAFTKDRLDDVMDALFELDLNHRPRKSKHVVVLKIHPIVLFILFLLLSHDGHARELVHVDLGDACFIILDLICLYQTEWRCDITGGMMITCASLTLTSQVLTSR